MKFMPLFRLASGRLTSFFVSFLALGLFGYALRSIDYFSAVPGDLGDARFNSVILEHVFRWITGQEESLWSPTFFYPFEHVLAFSDNHFGSAIFYVLLRFSGLSRELAFNGWYLTGIILSYFCTCWAFRRVGFTKLASSVGSFIFCFSLPVLHMEDNVQLIYRFTTPLAFVAFWNLLITKRLYLLWQVVFWGMIQFFCSIYLGVFLFYLLSATLLAWLIVAKKKNYFSELLSGFQKERPGKKGFFCIAICTSASMLAWLLYKYYAVTLEYPLIPPQGQPLAFLSLIPKDAVSFCRYVLNNFSFDNISNWFSTDSRVFFGFGVWGLFVLGIAKAFQEKSEKQIGIIAVITLLIFFVVTLSISGHSIYQLLAYIPGIRVLRAGSRMVLVMLLPIGILAAISVGALQKKAINASLAAKTLLLIGLFVLLGTEVVTFQPRNTPVHEWQARQNSLLEKLPAQLPSHPIILVTIKEGEPYYLSELDGMILAQDLGVPTLNGYSGSLPPGYLVADPCYSYLNRLYSYANYRNLPLSTIGPLAQRVVTIAPTPCAHEPAVGFFGDVNPAQVKDIVLRIEDVKKEKNTMTARIVIRNDSPSAFKTLTLSGKPIRLSWRIIPLSRTGERLSEPVWEARKDLYRTLSSAESIVERIDSTLPKLPGTYLFEVTLVQEGVAWFHDLGMQVAVKPIKVDNRQE